MYFRKSDNRMNGKPSKNLSISFVTHRRLFCISKTRKDVFFLKKSCLLIRFRCVSPLTPSDLHIFLIHACVVQIEMKESAIVLTSTLFRVWPQAVWPMLLNFTSGRPFYMITITTLLCHTLGTVYHLLCLSYHSGFIPIYMHRTMRGIHRQIK